MKLKERIEKIKEAIKKSNMSKETKRWLEVILEEYGEIRSSNVPITVLNPIGDWE